MNKKIILIWLIGILALPLSVAAVTATPPVKLKDATSTNATSTPKAVKGAIARCAIIESKIQFKGTGFDNAKIKHLAVYNNLKERLVKIADRLAARGADVTALRADLVILDQKIAKFNADWASYAAKMADLKEFTCGRSAGEFKDKLKETKAALQWVHRDAADIRAYFISTIRVEIMKIKEALKLSIATTTPDIATSTKAASSPKSVPPKPKVKPITPPLPKLD